MKKIYKRDESPKPLKPIPITALITFTFIYMNMTRHSSKDISLNRTWFFISFNTIYISAFIFYSWNLDMEMIDGLFFTYKVSIFFLSFLLQNIHMNRRRQNTSHIIQWQIFFFQVSLYHTCIWRLIWKHEILFTSIVIFIFFTFFCLKWQLSRQTSVTKPM